MVMEGHVVAELVVRLHCTPVRNCWENLRRKSRWCINCFCAVGKIGGLLFCCKRVRFERACISTILIRKMKPDTSIRRGSYYLYLHNECGARVINYFTCNDKLYCDLFMLPTPPPLPLPLKVEKISFLAPPQKWHHTSWMRERESLEKGEKHLRCTAKFGARVHRSWNRARF